MFEIDLKNKLINLIAKRNGGKSYLLRYLVKIQKNEFERIFIICPTDVINNFYKDITQDECIFSEYDEKWMQTLINRMTGINSKLDKNKIKNVLLILDDLVADVNFAACKSLRILAIRGRHLGISIIMTCQYMNTITPVLRNNCDLTIVGNLNRRSLDLLEQEYNTTLEKKRFHELYVNSTKNYNFLCINNNSVKNNTKINTIYGILKTPEEEFI